MMRNTLVMSIFFFTIMNCLSSQVKSISYESNAYFPNKEEDSPFSKFVGEWTLKEDTWIQNWGGKTDTIKIKGHHTLSTKINTSRSLLSIVDGPAPNGHIFWTYNPSTDRVEYLSSFGSGREGKGSGAFYGEGNIRLKVSFTDEASGTYRIYIYEWINKDEYQLKSVQYDDKGNPTGLFYEGRFIRDK